MAAEFDERAWLAWLVKVRIIIITFLLGIGLVIVRLTRTNIEQPLFVSVILLWYTLAVFFLVLYTLVQDAKIQARIQVLTDLAMCTVLIYVTGGIDTSFNFLYPLVIIVASILLPRWWAYFAASLSFIGFGAVLELSYFEVIRSYSITRPDIKSLQAIILINLFAYLAIAYLSSNLSQKLRQVDVQLQDKSGALEHLQVRHENIIHSLRGGLITTGLDGRITLINTPGKILLERDSHELIGKQVDEIFLDRLPNVDSYSLTGEARSRTPDGTEKTFGITVSPLTQPDRTAIGYVYTFDDLTDIRRLEREVRMRDRLSAVGRMAAGIAHEIRNPLSSIAGSVQVLSKISDLNEEQRTLVDIVTRESERLNHIISDFLIYSREKQMKITQVDLNALLDDTLTLLKNHPQQSEAATRVEISKKYAVTQAMALVDGDRMKQVFWNLSENALRAMSNKGGKLTVTLEGEDKDWRITFADTGNGIDQIHLEKIFEPFQSGFGVGTGLGLAIVYQILHAHGAKIAVHSKPGRGAEFVIRVRKMAQHSETRHEQAAIAGGAGG
ncbi:MAG: signal transduction histidine kinase, nitrogen specific, NtrB [Acidobacteriales bacterium]|nr:signal transduction histidine kinase, nitrogen specific, NtrB [Terriglobales bacterium]